MARDNAIDVPPLPVGHEVKLDKEVDQDTSTQKTAQTAPTIESETNFEPEKDLPNFEIVPNLKELEKIENRQNRLGSLTEDILKSRDLARKQDN